MAVEFSPHQLDQGVPRFVAFLSSLLQRIADSNDAVAAEMRPGRLLPSRKVTVFHGLARPPITVGSYLERIFTYANCSPCCYVVAYIYLDRFARHQPLVAIDSFSVHRLLITSVMIATKFMDDVCYNNAYFGKVGGISTLEMNYLERDFLFGLNFQLNVQPSTFQSYCAQLQREMFMENPPNPLRLQCFFSDSPDETNGQQQQQQQQQQLTV